MKRYLGTSQGYLIEIRNCPYLDRLFSAKSLRYLFLSGNTLEKALCPNHTIAPTTVTSRAPPQVSRRDFKILGENYRRLGTSTLDAWQILAWIMYLYLSKSAPPRPVRRFKCHMARAKYPNNVSYPSQPYKPSHRPSRRSLNSATMVVGRGPKMPHCPPNAPPELRPFGQALLPCAR